MYPACAVVHVPTVVVVVVEACVVDVVEGGVVVVDEVDEVVEEDEVVLVVDDEVVVVRRGFLSGLAAGRTISEWQRANPEGTGPGHTGRCSSPWAACGGGFPPGAAKTVPAQAPMTATIVMATTANAVRRARTVPLGS